MSENHPYQPLESIGDASPAHEGSQPDIDMQQLGAGAVAHSLSEPDFHGSVASDIPVGHELDLSSPSEHENGIGKKSALASASKRGDNSSNRVAASTIAGVDLLGVAQKSAPIQVGRADRLTLPAAASEASRIVHRHGRAYRVTPVVPIPTSTRIDQVIENLKSHLPTDAQKEAVEKYIRPGLEKFGVN